jgi:hypothetical protein
VIALNMVPAFMFEQMFSSAIAPPSNGVRRREGPGIDQTP